MHKMVRKAKEKEVTGEIWGMHNIHLTLPTERAVSFIFVPNVQRNIEIDYATGRVTEK